MIKNQSSIIELLLISVSASIALMLMLNTNQLITTRLKYNNDELVLINYLNYTSRVYEEKMLLIISAECSNNSFFKEEFFNESVEVIEKLNNNKTFILFINNTNQHVIYNNQSRVCLEKADLAVLNFNSDCGNGTITYGSWSSDELC